MARSRLKKPVAETNTSNTQSINLEAKKKRKSKFNNDQSVHIKYIKHLPLLLLAIICAFWTKNVLTTQYPTDVANILLPNAYITLLLPIFLTLTFLFGYITLNIQRGLVIGFSATLLLFFRLQNIEFELWWLILFFLLVTILFILEKKESD